ncbi:HEPN domain-containing protein [candidate division KSB1 bacterium]|nr:HEPN domain-containing protein [candidate division KSB1 bacterium]
MAFDKNELLNYRRKRCDETIEDARISIENNRLHNAENRIYYAIFYIVSALAVKNDFSTSKHWNLLSWFNQNFIKTGRLSKEFSRIYKNAFEKRQEGDYDDFTDFKIEEVKDDFENMIQFCNEIKKILEANIE